VVVKDLKELYKLLDEGYVPYYHRRVGRWYLRKGCRRVLIGKSLEGVAWEVAKELDEWGRIQEEYVGIIAEKAYELRARGAPISEVVKELGISKSTLYRLLNKRGRSP